MDGIVHATYVTARMHYALARLLAAGSLSGDEQEMARKRLESHERNFESGMVTVDRDGELTPLGHRVMQSARIYMSGSA